MRRRLLVLLSSLALLGYAPVSPAYAADTTVVIHGLDFPDDNAGLFATSCASPGDSYTGPPLLRYIDYTTDVPALGDRMVGFDPGVPVAIGPWHYTQTPSTVSVYSMRLNRFHETASGMALVFYDPPGGDGSYWVGYADVASSGTAATATATGPEPCWA